MIRSLVFSLPIALAVAATALNEATASPPKVGDSAADFTLKTLDDRPIQLKALHAKGPVVLVVLRGWPGYQCPLCTVQVGELVGKAKDLGARKAQVVLIYPGPAAGLNAHAAEFSRNRSLPANLHFVVDPDYTFTKSYDLRWDAAGETAYPSTFVIDADGKIAFAKISRTHGGRSKVGEILKALGD